MEANRTMCWIQPPGTPSVGHVYLDAYHATGDERFYEAAFRTAMAVKQAQRPEGGWNYIHDFAGEGSLKHWYDTIGRNGWRLEEFQHYYGNATFDDAGTAVASQFMLRMYLEKGRPALPEPGTQGDRLHPGRAVRPEFGHRRRRLAAALSAQPATRSARCRCPTPFQLPPGARAGMEDGDYTLHVTFNDDVMGENIKFLTMCVMALGETRLIDNITRAMDCMQRLQQPAPQAGWGLQHLSRPTNGRPAGAPAGARTYEPRSLTTHTTQTNIQQLFNYFTLTGDRKYLQRIPEAIAWLKSCPLPPNAAQINPLLGGGRTHPTFIELGTNDALYVHRYGSNIHNGAYYLQQGHPRHRQPLLGGPRHQHCRAGGEVRPARLDERRGGRRRWWRARRSSQRAPAALAEVLLAQSREVDFPDLFAGAKMVTPTVTRSRSRHA